MGILLLLLGGGLLTGLFHAAESPGFDTLLVASKSLYNVITGVRSIGLGIAQTLLGITQMLGFAALAVVSIAAVLAILSGAVRIGFHTLPRLSLIGNLLSHALHLALRFLAMPLAGGRQRQREQAPVKARQTKAETSPEPSPRATTARQRRAA